MRRRRVAAGHRVPERDRVAVHQQRLIDLLVHADRRDLRCGQPPGDAQLPLHPAQPVSGAGDPDHDRRGGQPVDRVLAESQQLSAVTGEACLIAGLPQRGQDRRGREPAAASGT